VLVGKVFGLSHRPAIGPARVLVGDYRTGVTEVGRSSAGERDRDGRVGRRALRAVRNAVVLKFNTVARRAIDGPAVLDDLIDGQGGVSAGQNDVFRPDLRRLVAISYHRCAFIGHRDRQIPTGGQQRDRHQNATGNACSNFLAHVG
jgi:hypothetical protein